MKKRYLLFLNDIMESMNRINSYTEGLADDKKPFIKQRFQDTIILYNIN